MADNTLYLKIADPNSTSPDLKGSVTQAGYVDWMQLESVEFGLSRNEPDAYGNFSGGGVNISQVKMTKWIDRASPLIAKYLDCHDEFNMTLNMIGPSETGRDEKVVTLDFKNCFFLQHQTRIEYDERPIETFTVFYKECEYVYEEDGISYRWDRPRQNR